MSDELVRLRQENADLRRDLQRALQSIARFAATADVDAILNRHQPPAKRASVVFPGARMISVEIADTRDRQMLGLMFRDELAPDEGMIFVYAEPGYYSFWMKNTRMPLDIFWLDAGGHIVAIQRSAQPCWADPCPHYWPPQPTGLVSYAIEVAAGFADANAVRVGDVVDITDVERARSASG